MCGGDRLLRASKSSGCHLQHVWKFSLSQTCSASTVSARPFEQYEYNYFLQAFIWMFNGSAHRILEYDAEWIKHLCSSLLLPCLQLQQHNYFVVLVQSLVSSVQDKVQWCLREARWELLTLNATRTMQVFSADLFLFYFIFFLNSEVTSIILTHKNNFCTGKRLSRSWVV